MSEKQGVLLIVEHFTHVARNSTDNFMTSYTYIYIKYDNCESCSNYNTDKNAYAKNSVL